MSRPTRRTVLGLAAAADFITVSEGIDVLSAEVPTDPALIAASDHRPVVAGLALARGSENHS